MSVPVSFDKYRHASFRKKWFYHILGKNFFLIFVPFIVSLLTQLTQRLILCLWEGGWGWEGGLKMYLQKYNFSRLFWNCIWMQNFFNFLGYNISSYSCLDFLFVIKHYFSSARDNLNKRPSHQVPVCPNWNWMLFSKLPCLLDAIWPIIATPDHFPVFPN